MTLEEMMAMKVGDWYFMVYDDGDVMDFTFSNALADRRDRGAVTASWCSCRFVTREDADEAAEMIKIQRALTR